MYNILMACNYPIFVKGLSAVIEELFDGEVEIQIANSLTEVQDALATGNIQLLALDLHLLEGKEFKFDQLKNFESLIRSNRSVNIMVMYDNLNVKLFKWMYLLGIQGILGKASPIIDIQACLEKVCKNQLYIENDLLMDFVSMPQQKPKKESQRKRKIIVATLTKREKLVAKLLIEGKSNTQICTLLQLQPSTVSTFKQHVFRKLQINSLIELEKFKQIAV